MAPARSPRCRIHNSRGMLYPGHFNNCSGGVWGIWMTNKHAKGFRFIFSVALMWLVIATATWWVVPGLWWWIRFREFGCQHTKQVSHEGFNYWIDDFTLLYRLVFENHAILYRHRILLIWIHCTNWSNVNQPERFALEDSGRKENTNGEEEKKLHLQFHLVYLYSFFFLCFRTIFESTWPSYIRKWCPGTSVAGWWREWHSSWRDRNRFCIESRNQNAYQAKRGRQDEGECIQNGPGFELRIIRTSEILRPVVPCLAHLAVAMGVGWVRILIRIHGLPKIRLRQITHRN